MMIAVIFVIIVRVIGVFRCRPLRRRACDASRRRLVTVCRCGRDGFGDDVVVRHWNRNGNNLDRLFVLVAADLFDVLVVFFYIDDVWRVAVLRIFRGLFHEVVARRIPFCTGRGRRTAARPSPASECFGTPVGSSLELGLRSSFFIEKRLPVGDRDLIVVRMDFVEGEKTVPVAAVIDESSLQ